MPKRKKFWTFQKNAILKALMHLPWWYRDKLYLLDAGIVGVTKHEDMRISY